MRKVHLLEVLGLLFAVLATASAQTVIGDFAIAGGGGIVSDASNRILFTIGQPAAGPIPGSPFAIHAGYLGADYVITGVVGKGPNIPTVFALHQNFPNPFNPSTTIRYDVPHSSHVSLVVYNMLGQEVATLVESEQGAGYQEVRFDATSLASGVYFYRLQAEDFIQTMKLMLLK
jgi:hypothetical protein